MLSTNNLYSHAGLLGWPFPVLKYKYIFQIKYTETVMVWKYEMLIAINVLFVIFFCTLLFPIACRVLNLNFTLTWHIAQKTCRLWNWDKAVSHMLVLLVIWLADIGSCNTSVFSNFLNCAYVCVCVRVCARVRARARIMASVLCTA